MDSVNSTTFIKRPPHMTPANEGLLYTKEILSRCIFLGCYEERRYVSVLREYRDVVVISSEETKLHKDLDKVRKKWLGIPDIEWVGITGPDFVGEPKAYCFWVKFSNLPFGHYWFQIKHVKCTDVEVFLQLKCIRKAGSLNLQNTPFGSETVVAKNEVPVTSTAQESTSFHFDPKTTMESIEKSWKEAFAVIKPYLTWKNFLTFIRVMVAVTISIIYGCISTIPSLGEFTLKLIRELSFLVQSLTPIIIQVIDFVTKVVGGIFIILAHLCGKRPIFLNNNGGNYHQIESTRFLSARPITSGNDDWRERNEILRRELLGNRVRR